MKLNNTPNFVKTFPRLILLVLLQICFSTVTIAQAASTEVRQVDVIKAQSDDRDIKYYELPNGLKALLISDPSVEKSAASMDVWVGSSDDPMDRQGLAHFLEHMLFLGTKKYPDADEYQDFIAGHGGTHNAFTSATHTNYFFDIKHEQFESALDRFAQFFISPLFNAKYVERERNAVNSEYTAKYTDEYRRIRDVYREIALPGHPVNRFSVGNLDTLQVTKPRDLRKDLIDFYDTHYSADRMGLVVISNQPLAVLHDWIMDKFSSVPNRKLQGLPDFESFIANDKLPLTVEVKPRTEMREISFVFSVPSSEPYYQEKPLTYIGFFIGHESEGSLLSVLKSLNWATALSAGSSLAWRGGEAFSVTINLTEIGLQNTAAIEQLLFDYIDKLKSHGLEKWRYDEIHQLGEMAFEYGDKQNPMNEVMGLSSGLHVYPPELVLKAPNLYAKFDKKLIQQFLGHLTPEQCVRVLVHDKANITTETQYYQTPYGISNQKLPSKVDKAVLLEAEQKLALPEKNRFIPGTFAIVDTTAATEKPQELLHKNNVSLWFKTDDKFNVPKGYVNVRLFLPEVAKSVEGAAAARLYASVTKELLNETSYSAAMAGLGFDINASSRGIDLSFTGYSDSLGQLVKAVVNDLGKYNSNEKFRNGVHDRFFDDASNELLRRYKNMSLDTPYRKLLKNLPAQIFSPYWAPQTLASTLENMGRDEYQHIAASMFDSAQMEVLVFGNYERKSALRMGKQLSKLVSRKKPGRAMVDNRVVNFSENKTGLWKLLPVEHSDAGVAYYIQGSDDSIAENARMLVLQQMLATPFYTTLRTEKQLGYVVFTSGYPIREVPAIIAVVQSPAASTEVIVKEIDKFFETQSERVLENFDRDKAAVLALLREDAKSQNELASDFWQSIISDDFKFDRKQRLIAAVELLTGKELGDYYKKQLLNPKMRLIVATPPDQEPKFLNESYKKIENTQTFKSAAPTYNYP